MSDALETGRISAENRQVIERLIDCINGQRIEVMDELFHDDAVMDWPQSGEQVIGAENRRAIYKSFPQLPKITPRRFTGSGDLLVLEATLDYGSPPAYKAVFIFEFRDRRIQRETAYWSQPFEAPAWRSKWVKIVLDSQVAGLPDGPPQPNRPR